MKFLQLLRSFHAWLGVLTLPWIIAFGLTGFYLNHRDMVLSAISGPEINEADFPLLPSEVLLDAAGAILIAQKLDVELAKQAPVAEIYHDADAFVFYHRPGIACRTDTTMGVSVITGHLILI